MSDDSYAAQPAVVPARMVNEFVYCPRFFHLAWSGNETGENVEGQTQSFFFASSQTDFDAQYLWPTMRLKGQR